MIQFLRSSLERFRESLFFVPGMMIVGAIAVAALVLRLDERVIADTDAPLLVSVTVSSARTILATVAGATITVAGIVFAMTAVTVQLAASTYSPRIIRGFQRDRFQQFAIGAAAGTFTYCLLAMSSIQSPSQDASEAVTEPRLSVTLGVVFGVGTIVVIVAFIDHVVRNMRVDEVIRSTADDTTEIVRRTLSHDAPPDELTDRRLPEGSGRSVEAPRTGWVRTIDRRRLAEDIPGGARLRLDVTVGGFVTEGLPIGRVWTDTDEPFDVARAIEIGRTRSLEEDPRYGIQLLVDIALRALSPGINDPTTAVTVVLHLERPMIEVLARRQQSAIVRADGDRILFTPNEPGHAEFVTLAFRPIIVAGADSTPVLLAVVDVLGTLRQELLDRELDERIRHLEAEAVLVADAAGNLVEPDRIEVLERLERAHLVTPED